MSEMTYDPAAAPAAPGSRRDRAQNAAAQAQPDPAAVAAAQAAADPGESGLRPVPVSSSGALRTVGAAVKHGNYFTVVLPVSTALAPGVRQILSRDDERVIAHIVPIDGPVVVATTLEQAQDPANVGGTFPAGVYMPAGGYPVTHREPVWACNTSTTATCRVAVMVETGGAE